MSVEAMRGCGYRKVGGLYLCGGGASMACDRIPYELKICPVCGSGIKFTRGWTWIDWLKYAGMHGLCTCSRACPICWPTPNHLPRGRYGLLWVGEANYTPQAFIQEALTMGVSRKIAAVPKNLKLGETWVLFAHKKAVYRLSTQEEIDAREYEAQGNFMVSKQSEGHPAVFYAFRPQTLELLIWESDAKPEYLEDLLKRKITPIIIPDGDEDHHPDTKTKMTSDDREAVERTNTIAALRNKIGR